MPTGSWNEILRTRTENTLGGREASVAHPQEAPAVPAPGQPAEAEVQAPRAVRVLSLADALEIAYRTNRDTSRARSRSTRPRSR